jgi:hypothetical protein
VNFSNFVSQRNHRYLSDLAEEAENFYRRQVQREIERYNRGLVTDADLRERLLQLNPQSGLKDLYFVPRHLANEYFTVSHILVKYTTEQEAELKQIKARYAQDNNLRNYQNDLQRLQSQLRVRERNAQGEEFGPELNAWQVLGRVQNMVDGKDMQGRIDAFHRGIYMFGGDGGMNNAEFEYVVGVNHSEMVPEFTDAARELFNYQERTRTGGRVQNAVGDWVDARGAMSGLVWTDFGAHIIMYTRNIHDFVFTNTADNMARDFRGLLHATHTSYGNKTTFDAIIEQLKKPSFENFENGLVTEFKRQNQVTIRRGNFKDLFR